MASKGVEEAFRTDIEALEGMIAEMERSGLYDMAEELRESLDTLKHDIDVLPRDTYLRGSLAPNMSLEDPLNNVITKVINLKFKYGYKLSVEKLTDREILNRDAETIESTIGESALDVSWKELDRVYDDFVRSDRTDLEREDAKKIIAKLEYKLLEDEAINNEKVSLYRVHDRKALVEVCSRKLMELARKEREMGSKKESELNLLARSIDENSLADDSLWETLTGVRGLKVRSSVEDMSRRVKKAESKAIQVVPKKEEVDPHPVLNGRTRAMLRILGHDTVIKLRDGSQRTVKFSRLMKLFDDHLFGEKDYLLDEIIGMYTEKEVLETLEKSSRDSNKFHYLRYLALGEGVRRVEGGMFRECRNLEELEVGSDVEFIGERAFSATDLRKVTFRPNTKLTYIESRAFEYNRLRGLDLSMLSNLEGIGDGAFTGSTNLKAVALPITMRFIGMNAFKDSPIEDINFPPGITDIGVSAFMGSHLKEVILPEDIEHIGENAFASNRYLEKMEFPDGTVFLSKERNYVGDVPLDNKSQEPIEIIPKHTAYRNQFEILGGGEFGPKNFSVYATERFSEVNHEYLSRGNFQKVVIVNEQVKDDIRRKRKEALSVGYSVPSKEAPKETEEVR